MRAPSLLLVAIGLGCTFDSGVGVVGSGELVETESSSGSSSSGTTTTSVPASSSGATGSSSTSGTTGAEPTTSSEAEDTREATAFVQELLILAAADYDLPEVPLLVRLTAENSQWSAIAPDLSNLRFMGRVEGDDIELPFELGGAGDDWVQLWVLVPEVSTEADRFHVEYGTGVRPSAWAPGDVWSAYEAVWHLEEDPADPEPQYRDSSGNDRDISNTANDSIPSEDMVPGIVGRAPRFAQDRELQITGSTWPTSNIGERFTLEAWVQYEELPPQAYRSIVYKSGAYELVGSRNQTDPLIRPAWSVNDGGGFRETTASAQSWQSGGVWNYAAATFERTRGPDMVRTALYIDGVEVATEEGADYQPTQNAADFRIGSNLTAVVDEVRVSQEVRPPRWFDLQNLSMRDQLLEYGEATPLSP